MSTGRLLTPKEAAARLSITVEQLAALVRDGEIAYVGVGRGAKRPRRRFTEVDLDEFIQRRRRREVGRSSHSVTEAISRGESISSFSALREARLAQKQSAATTRERMRAMTVEKKM